MILFKKQDFQGNEDKFRTTVTHENSWSFYTVQYEFLLQQLNKTALQLNYQLNVKSYPYLFILRHYCELKLKSIISQNGGDVPNDHEFIVLYDLLNDVPQALKNAISYIDFDSDGSCFRYMYDKHGNLNPLYRTEKKILPFFSEQSIIPLGSIYDLSLGIQPPFKKMLHWELTFHFNEITSQGQLRSAYDEVTDYTLKKVICGELDVNKIYLPLLFLIRHSIELVLKDSLLELIHIQDEQTAKKVNRLVRNEHKLSELFKWYLKMLPADVSGLPMQMQEQYTAYLVQSERLKANLHILDTNSRYFRYPYDPSKQHNFNLPSDALLSIISDFLTVDSFLTFNVDVLKDYNIVPYSDKEVAEMMGFDPSPY